MSQYGHSLSVVVVNGETGAALKIGSDAGMGREIVTPDEAREFALSILIAVQTAEQWHPVETVQSRKGKARAARIKARKLQHNRG